MNVVTADRSPEGMAASSSQRARRGQSMARRTPDGTRDGVDGPWPARAGPKQTDDAHAATARSATRSA